MFVQALLKLAAYRKSSSSSSSSSNNLLAQYLTRAHSPERKHRRISKRHHTAHHKSSARRTASTEARNHDASGGPVFIRPAPAPAPPASNPQPEVLIQPVVIHHEYPSGRHEAGQHESQRYGSPRLTTDTSSGQQLRMLPTVDVTPAAARYEMPGYGLTSPATRSHSATFPAYLRGGVMTPDSRRVAYY